MSPTTAALSERRPLAGAAAALTGVALWGTLVILVKTGEETNGLVIGFHRIWVGALGVSAVALASGQFPDRQAFRASAAGGLFFAADIVLFFSAIKLTTVANATPRPARFQRCAWPSGSPANGFADSEIASPEPPPIAPTKWIST